MLREKDQRKYRATEGRYMWSLSEDEDDVSERRERRRRRGELKVEEET